MTSLVSLGNLAGGLASTILATPFPGLSANPGAPVSPFGIPLSVGPVVFQDLEIPERFGPIGGYQAMARHAFPGGIITLQNFGPFPEPLRWGGYLTGAAAFDRSQQLDRLRATGQTVVLRYGRFAWIGVVSSYAAEPGHQYLVPYRITFEPQRDISGVGSAALGTVSAETQMAGLQASTTRLIAGAFGLTLPVSLVGVTTAMQSTTTQAMQNAGGQVANISTADALSIQSATQAVNATGAPLTTSSNASTAQPALEAMIIATGISTLVGTPGVSRPRTISTVNPNLFLLAQQYYGDQGQWTRIASANRLQDPQPRGTFPGLVIP